MYTDCTAIKNPDLSHWVEKLSGMSAPEIDDYLKRYDQQSLPVPAAARSLLENHEWATAARAICMRAPGDDPEKWRNAVPTDRVPIILNFKNAEPTDHGYIFSSTPAADYNHKNEYRYVGLDEKGNYQFVNEVTRSHKTDAKDVTVGHELLVLSPKGEAVTLYLDNDGNTKGLPKEFREVRLLKDLKTTYTDVIHDIGERMKELAAKTGLTENEIKEQKSLPEHLAHYQSYLAKLTP